MGRKKLRILVADCETDPFLAGRIARPFIWGLYDIYSREYRTFGSAELFAAYISEIESTIYFHNGGKFDIHYLRPYADSDQKLLIINGRIASLRIGRAELRDSYNIIPVPLARYSKEKVDYSIFEKGLRDLPENVPVIERYLKSDCVNLGDLVRAYFDRYGRGITQAGAAMNYWAKHYNHGRKPKQSAAQFERYRPFYYGGRVECFAKGYHEQAFTVVDKNSAYPHAMLFKHPISTEAIPLSSLPRKDAQISQCMVSLRAVSRGALPYRLPSGELIFPRDDRERIYDVTGWEVQAGLEENALDIKEILKVHFFRETVSFEEYINYFYLERRAAQANGDKAGDIFAKLFMNSCYGKFASNPEHYNEYVLSSNDKLAEWVSDGYSDYHDWGDGRRLLWRKLPLDRHHYYNIATAASITGFVRAGLFRDLCRVRTPLYCDTDSISAVDVSALSQGKELGQWKVELVCDARAIVGKKMYAFRSAYDQQWDKDEQKWKFPKGAWKVASKGVKFGAEQMLRAAQGEVVQYEPDVPCYSITRPQPKFINRNVRMTATIQMGSLLGVH